MRTILDCLPVRVGNAAPWWASTRERERANVSVCIGVGSCSRVRSTCEGEAFSVVSMSSEADMLVPATPPSADEASIGKHMATVWLYTRCLFFSQSCSACTRALACSHLRSCCFFQNVCAVSPSSLCVSSTDRVPVVAASAARSVLAALMRRLPWPLRPPPSPTGEAAPRAPTSRQRRWRSSAAPCGRSHHPRRHSDRGARTSSSPYGVG